MEKKGRVCDDAMVQSRIRAIALPSETGEFADDVRRIFRELGRVFGSESLAGECSPAVDVYETDDAIEILVDLPGVDDSVIRILSKGDSVLIAGEKPSKRARPESSFHLVERGYGRFARVLRLGRAYDVGKARAALRSGELRISLPKTTDRRGRTIQIPISPTTPPA